MRTFWLSERVRSGAAAAFAVAVTLGAAFLGGDTSGSITDAAVLALVSYLVVYLGVTAAAFTLAEPATIQRWAERTDRGTFLQRYLYGTAPGPGVSLLFAAAALFVAMVWLPTGIDSDFDRPVRLAITAALVIVSWSCVVVSFAVAFCADNLVEHGRGLDFPQPEGQSTPPGWSDYIYFSFAVMTTFGTTDVSVISSELRRTVTANAVIAFVFNTVIVATLVSAMAQL